MKKTIINYLDELYNEPRCELNYNKDYELLIAVMLSAQTTDKRVNEVTKVLFSKYDTLDKLSKADINDLKSIIRSIGSYNKKAIYIKDIATSLIKDKNGIVPNDRKYLESLNGVGRKTTNVVLANLFNTNVIAVDTHVSRVSKRLGIASLNDTPDIVEEKLYKYFKGEDFGRLHHQLVLFGRYHCKAIKPNCSNCKLKDICKGM